MMFSHEPVSFQRETIMNLMKDFEQANGVLLQNPTITSEQLVMPFQVIIQRAGRL